MCSFKGVLRLKTVITDTYVNSISDSEEELRERPVCITCYDTPAGCRSENLDHERLPEAEYK